LDDADPETEAEQRQMLSEFIERCQSAESVMEDQREHFQTLRNLEREAPRLLERLPDEIEAVEARIADAEQQLARVRADAPASAEDVAGNIPEARKRLDAAREVIEAGQTALEQDDTPAAALSVRTGQETVAQATQLLDAVAKLTAQLDEARSNSGPLRADV